MNPKIIPLKLHRKERIDGIQSLLVRHKKELPKIDPIRITDPMSTRQWVTVSSEDKKIISAGRVVKNGVYHWVIKDLITDNMYRKKGIASEVVNLLVKKAIKDGAKVIESEVSYDNIPVKKIFEKLGFKEEKNRRRGSGDNILYVFRSSKRENNSIKNYTPSLYRL